jgi:predicted nucleotidyltransferase
MRSINTTITSRIRTLVWEIDPSAEVILYGSRARGDYGDFFDFEGTDIISFIPKVEEFLKNIDLLIKTDLP